MFAFLMNMLKVRVKVDPLAKRVTSFFLFAYFLFSFEEVNLSIAFFSPLEKKHLNK